MIDLIDWRTAGRWGALVPLAGDMPQELDPTRFIWRWLCAHCERFYVTACGAPAQWCPGCGHQLARVGGVWDLCREYAPRWWRDPLDPGERPW